MAKKTERARCFICGSTKSRLFYKNVKGFRISRGFDIRNCLICETYFTYPHLNQSELNTYYLNQETAFNGAEADKAVEEYLEDKTKFWKLLGYENRLDEIKKLSPNAKTILDIGCGAGFFLDYARSKGYKTYGLELTKWGSTTARKKFGLNVLQKDLAALKDNELPRLDVITMYDVLEHSSDPVKMLESAWRFMNKDGILIINLPNIDSLVSKATGKYWNKLIPPNHLFHFNKETLTKLIESRGFKVELVVTNNGSPDELAAEVLNSFWRLPSILVPSLERAFSSREEVEQVTFFSVPIKFTKRVFAKMGFLVDPLLFILPALNLGEGLRLVARK